MNIKYVNVALFYFEQPISCIIYTHNSLIEFLITNKSTHWFNNVYFNKRKNN